MPEASNGGLGAQDCLDSRQFNWAQGVAVVLNRAPTHGASLDMPAAQDVLTRFEHVEDSDLVVRESAAIRRATPYGMLVDEYGAADKNAAHKLGEVYRLVYGVYPARSVEIQEPDRCKCNCAQVRGKGRHRGRAGRP